MRVLTRRIGTRRPGESKGAPTWALDLVQGRTQLQVKVADETDNV